MEKEIELDYAISETLSVHPEFASYISNIIYKNIYNGTNPVNFTSRVRNYISTARQVDFINYILEEAITIYTSAQELTGFDLEDIEKKNLSKLFPKLPVIIRAIDILKDKENNTILYYLYNRVELFELIDAVCKTTFKKGFYTGVNLANDTRNKFHGQLEKASEHSKESGTLRRFLRKELNSKAVKGVKNLYINYEAINRCRREILLGRQVKQRHNEYALGSCLYATQDIGRRRKNQEDSVLIMEHPTNPNFKIMAVADGMGGHEAGEVASSYILEKLSAWFENIDYYYYERPQELQMMLCQVLQTISKGLYNYLGSDRDLLVGGATFTGAIVTEDQTIIASVGDSRAYALSGEDLKLITKDESAVWDEMAKRKAAIGSYMTEEEIDSLRFNPRSNVITRCMGEKDLEYIQSYVINNDSYDELLLFTDGVTDLLSHNDIKLICATTAPEELTNTLVAHATNHSVTERLRGSSEEVELIRAGKDNATAVAYFRR